MSKIKIIFHNDRYIFFPGQSIAGYVEVSLPQVVSCKSLSIKLKGFAKVKFLVSVKSSGSDSHSQTTQTKHCAQTENYYSLKYNLWGDGAISQEISEGNHQFPFTFILPPSTPSSFESKYGFIRHICEAELKFTSVFKRNLIFRTPFSVISILDLNFDQLAQHPILVSEEKTFCCLCCTSGPISFMINIDHRGFVPGEDIVINAECTNRSKNTISKSRAEVQQVTSYRAQGNYKTVQKVVCFKELPKISPGEDCIWSSEFLKVPSLPPSNLLGCNIIDIRYIFVFKLVPYGPSSSLESNTDIVIGSIPLQRCFKHFVTAASSQPFHDPQASGSHIPYQQGYLGESSAPSAPPLIFPGSEKYPDLPPPSYEECVFGENSDSSSHAANPAYDDVENDDSFNIQFSPRYITYGGTTNQNHGSSTVKDSLHSSNQDLGNSVDQESEFIEENNFKI